MSPDNLRTLYISNPPCQLGEIWRAQRNLYLADALRPAIGLDVFRNCDFPRLGPHLWLASSGTTGSVKLVAISLEALQASAAQVNKHLEACTSDVWINPLPCHHIGGLSIYVRAELTGCRVVYLHKWQAGEFVRQAESCAATLASLVPTQVHDLVAAGLRCPASLRAVVVGGGALEDALYEPAGSLGWPLLRSYGLTEAASQVATESCRGDSAAGWLPVLDHYEARTVVAGVLELRGPSLLTGWMISEHGRSPRWEDPKVDGWFRTSDRVELHDRELRVLGRVDDLVKIRGELVDVAGLERALQERVVSGEVMVRCVSDRRTGAALHVVVENDAAVSEAKDAQNDVFPPFARPERITTGSIKRTVLGKKIRG